MLEYTKNGLKQACRYHCSPVHISNLEMIFSQQWPKMIIRLLTNHTNDNACYERSSGQSIVNTCAIIVNLLGF